MRRRESLMLFAGCLLPARVLRGQYAPAVPDWNRPVAPFRVLGNLFYVGASDVSAFLLATSDGNILLDSGFRETLPLIEANLGRLGFRMEDLSLILTSHAHYDHIGGMADLKRRTKARFLVNPAEAAAFQRGGKGDFAFGDKYPFPPIDPDGLLRDGTPVVLGTTALTPHFTPGHTKGCTSWTTRIEEAGSNYDVVIASSMSAPGYRLVANDEYPEIARDYEDSFAKLRALPCDVFLSLHSWDFGFHNKLKARKQGTRQNPFVDPGGLAAFVNRTHSAFQKQYDEQRAAATGPHAAERPGVQRTAGSYCRL
jgi:metallo-beta-lactamase class B